MIGICFHLFSKNIFSGSLKSCSATLKSTPEVVATGVASRLLRRNEQSAVNYLAAQAGISSAEAAGWIAFGILFLGSISAMLGGAFGAQLNMRKPVDSLDRKAMRKPSHA